MIYLIFGIAVAAALYGIIEIGSILRVAFSGTTSFSNVWTMLLSITLATACVVLVAWLGPIAIAGIFF